MPDASSPIDPSRHQSQTDQPADPIPIPEADARGRKARTVRIQDILAAHARALDVRLEEGMREMRLAMEAAVRRSDIREVPEPTPASPPQPAPAPSPQVAPPIQQPLPQQAPLREDVARGLAQQTDERFQALAMRLQRIEDAVRTVALAGGGAELGNKIEELTEGMNRVAATEEEIFDRFLDSQRAGLEDLTRRVGAGVAAVIRAMQTELTATITRLELTADASVSVAPDDAARLERTMMAIAERQEAVLDARLAELRESIGGFQPVEETVGEVEESPAEEAPAETDKAKTSKTDREAEREAALTSFEEEAWPWPEPDGAAAVDEAEASGSAESKDGAKTEEPDAGEDAPAEEKAETDSNPDPKDTDEAPEVGQAVLAEEEGSEEASAEEKPAPKKRRRRTRKKKPATES